MAKVRRLMGAWTWIGVVVVAGIVLGVRTLALPTPSQFELDGNAVVESSDDWANTVPPPPGAGSAALASTFVADGSSNATIFTTGGSKDINDINQWQWKDQLGGLPDKDNLTNAYAAAYTDATGDLIIYFGADRFTTEGDAQIGFWFFKSQVQTTGGIFTNGQGQPAVHQNGDILVLANMSNGGTVFTAQVYQWLNGSLSPIQTQPGDAHCGTNTDPRVCFTVNSATAVAPWSYLSKSGSTSFPALTFFEGGINITDLVGATAGCFSSFLAETRSSTSTSATLKDFALGQFNTCSVQLAKDCPTVTYDPTTNLLSYTVNLTVTNDGFGTLFDLAIEDLIDGQPAPVQLSLQTLAVGASHTFSFSFTQTPSPTMPNPPSDVATVRAAGSPGGSQTVTATASATCQKVEFDSQLTITKTCTSRVEAVGGQVVVRVDVGGTVCNLPPDPASGEFPESISGIVVSDTPPFSGGNISIGTLLSGQCVDYVASYYPSGVSGSGLPHEQTYSDTVLASGTGTVSGATRQNTATANCPLCP